MIKRIQSLRAIAAMGIVLYHSGEKIASLYPNTYHNPFYMGDSGVDLFFIISGFVMIYTIESKTSNNAWQFLLRRFIRIVPLYWFTTSVFIALLLLTPNIFQNYRFNLLHSIYSYLFLPQAHPPVISIGWTLVYIMYFYVVLAICIGVGCRSKAAWLTVVFLISYILGLLLPEYKIYPVVELISSELLLEFGAGILLFLVYKKGIRISLPVAIGVIALGVLLFPLLEEFPRLYSYGLPMSLIFAGVVLCRRELLNLHSLHYLGDASYSLYLIQVFTVPACGVLTKKLAINALGSSIILIALYTVITIGAAIGLYIIIEKPVTVYLKTHLDTKRIIAECS